MITKWEDIPGVKHVHYGTFKGAVLVFEDDSFAVVDAALGYEGEAYPVLAKEDDQDALDDAVKAGASGAQELLDVAKAKFNQSFEERERARLAYLLKKYREV